MARRRRRSRREQRRGEKGVEDALKAQAERKREYQRDLAKLLRVSLRGMISADLLKAIERGQTGVARAAVKRAKTSQAIPLVKRVASRAWDAGRAEGDEDVARLTVDTFQEPELVSPARLRVLRERAERDARYKATGPESRMARQEARAIMRSFAAHMRDEIAEGMSRARESGNSDAEFKRLREILQALKEGRTVSPAARRFVRNIERRTREVAAGPLLEVDWEVTHRGQRSSWQKSSQVILAEYSGIQDDTQTTVCQFLLDGTMIHNDRRLDGVSPRNHYNCRSRFVAFAGTSDDVNWDTRIRKSIGEPMAGSPKRKAYSIKRAQIRVPGAAPNQAPPQSLSEWVV